MNRRSKAITNRNQSLYRYWQKHPDMTMLAIARIFHLKSKQHVYGIIKQVEKENNNGSNG